MRENKFKCWDKKLNKWVDIFTHKIGVQLTDVGFAMSTGWDSEDNPTWDFSKVEFNRYEYPQFTGLLDKNGKEIYEGDIIEMTDPYGENKAQTEIKYNNGAFTVEADGWFGMGECDVTSVGWAQEEDVSMEVIGNIYENPELLV